MFYSMISIRFVSQTTINKVYILLYPLFTLIYYTICKLYLVFYIHIQIALHL